MSQAKLMKRIVLATLTVLSISVGAVLGTKSNAQAATSTPNSIINSDLGASVPKSGEQVDGKYKFIAKTTSNTKLAALSKKHLGAYSVNKTEGQDEYDGLDLSLSSKDAVKGEVGALYTNVGYIDGKPVDLAITVTDWIKNIDLNGSTSPVDDIPQITFDNDNIAWYSRAADINVLFNYYYHGTSTPANSAGFMTFTDIDYRQGTLFSSNTTNNIKKYYVPNADSIVSGQKVGDKAALYESQGLGAGWFHADDPEASTSTQKPAEDATVTMLMDEMNNMGFTWTTSGAGKDANHNFATAAEISKLNQLSFTKNTNPTDYTNISDIKTTVVYPTGNYERSGAFTYSGEKPLQTATVPPTKTVSDNDEKLTDKDTLDKLSEPIIYHVQQTIPMEVEDFYYGSATMTDTIPDLLKIDSVKITDENGKDRTSFFTNQSSGNVLKYTATASAIKSADFYEHTYDWQITTHIDLTKDLTKYVENGIISFDNNATFNIDDDSKTSNTVNTKVNALGKININKQDLDSTSKKLAGAQFSLYKTKADATSGSNAIKTITTDSNGNGVFTDLSLVDSTKGTYYLKEVKAPSGYQLDSTVREVKAVEDSAGVKINNVNDEQKINIPATGSKNNAAFASAGVISVIGLVLVLAGFEFSKQRNQND